MQKLKIWITGGNGSLGREVINALEKNRPDLKILAPSRAELDLTKKEQVEDFVGLHKPAYVIHLAAKVYGISGHRADPAGCLIDNTKIDFHVFSSLLEHPPRWIFYASTVAAYGYPYKTLPLMESDWLSGLPHESEFGYAMAKRHSLSYLHILKTQYQSDYTFGLITNLFSLNDRFQSGNGHVLISLLEKAKEAKANKLALQVWGDGSSSRDFLPASLAAEVIVDLIGKHTGVVNIASGTEITIKQIVAELIEVFDLQGGAEFLGINSGIGRRYCSSERLGLYTSTHRGQSILEMIKSDFQKFKELELDI